MPSIKDPTTVQAIAREYCSNGRDKAEAMRTIGYAESSCKSGRAVGDVYGNVRVKAAILAIDEAGAAKSETTIESVQEMYNAAYALAQTGNQPSAMVSAVTGIARLYGMDKQTTVTEHTPDQPEGQEADVLDTLNKEYKLKLSGTG
jgi:hypothetical protein